MHTSRTLGTLEPPSPSIGVPRIIMQTWKTRDVPEHWKESPESIRRFLPDWQYVLMTDEDHEEFVRAHYADFLDTYLAFPHAIQRADAIRPLWLKKHGGVYMDLDFVLQRPLDELFAGPDSVDAYFVRSGNISQTLTNSFMASKPGAAVWDAYIAHMRKPAPIWAQGKHMTVMSTTGPLALDSAVKASATDYRLLPAKLIAPCSVCDLECFNSRTSILRPLQGSSWHSADSRAFNFLLCHRQQIAAAVAAALVIIIILVVLLRLRVRS